MEPKGQQAENVALAGDVLIARSAMYPRVVIEGEMEWKCLLDLFKYNKKSNLSSYGMSVCAPSLLDEGDNVHAYGCRLSVKQNTAIRERAAAAGKPAGAERFYLGSYYARVSWILDAASEGCALSVIVKPELGEKSHCEIILSAPEGVEKDLYAEARTDAIIEIANGLVGPDRHVCGFNQEDADWLSKVELLDNGYDLASMNVAA